MPKAINMRILLITLFILAFNLNHAQSKKVLYLGNSYTNFNNLPELIYQAGLTVGDTILYNSNTPGGTTLSQHAANATSLNLIQSDNWDHIVIQAQSQEPSFPIGQVEAQTFPFAQQLCDAARANDPCTRPIFYMTWGRENGDASNCPNWPPVCTYEGMDSLLSLRYQIMAADNEALVSPVGAVWRYIRDNHPSIDLYTADGSHPSQAGSYLASITFYTIIMQKDPTAITYNFVLPAATADIIKNAAKLIAFDNLSMWNVGAYDPTADFTYSESNGTVSFVNNSTHFDDLLWDFGNSNSSTLTDPTHDYNNGTYDVTLIASSCGLADTFTTTIAVSTATQIETINQLNLLIYPNPTKDRLNILNSPNKELHINLFSAAGKLVLSADNTSSLNLADFKNGLYILEIKEQNSAERTIQKILKE